MNRDLRRPPEPPRGGSIRGWIALLVVLTGIAIMATSVMSIEPTRQLGAGIVVLVLGAALGVRRT